jgi:hypothetical protein
VYLARQRILRKERYYIRESYRDPESGVYAYRDLCDLGTDPARLISYPGRYSIEIHEEILALLRSQGVEVSHEELERIFWPFVTSEIKRNLEAINYHRPSHHRPKRLTEEEADRLLRETHLFDRRRICYLRYGNLDQSRLGRVPLKLFRVLLDKSRDEIEQYFLEMEEILRPGELKRYVFVIFDLQRFFAKPNACILPHILDQNELDGCFVKEICALDRDAHFWSGVEKTSGLHEYLARYAVMFFDYDFAGFSPWDDYIRDFMGRHREFRFPDVERSATLEEASTVFGVAADNLKSMNKRELTRLYRRKAHSLHPDKGGEHEAFVELTKIYQELLQHKK